MEGTSGWSTLGLFAEVRRHAALRRAHLASASGVGSAASSPRRSRPVRDGVSRHQVPGANRGRGEVPARAIALGNVEHRSCSAPDLVHLRRLSRTKGNFRSSPGSRPDRGSPWIEMFGWSVVVLVEMSTCRSRKSVRGLESARESGSSARSSRCHRTPVKTRGTCVGRLADSARRGGLS
jgi:hypothetical protein